MLKPFKTLFSCVSALAFIPISLSALTHDGWGDGVNVMPGYFNEADKGNIPVGWELMRKYDRIKTVRIEISPEQGVSVATMQDWIRQANACGYHVIATHHDYHNNGSDDPQAVMEAALWWKAHYAALREAGPFTINLINEWGGHGQTPESFAAAYNAALPVIREFYDGPVIVDIPGWAQETTVAAEASPLIKDDNIVLSVHIYTSAYVVQGPHHWMQPEDLVELAKVNRPVMIGEFGGMREGGADWRALVQQAKNLGWTVLAWAWDGDGEGMNMMRPNWNDDPLPAAYWPDPNYFGEVYSLLGDNSNPKMEVSVKENITMGSQAGFYSFTVFSDSSWDVSVEGGDGWVVGLRRDSVWGSKPVRFDLTENDTGALRTATVTVRCGDIEKSFPILQKPYEPPQQ